MTAKPRILYVDDEKENLFVFQRSFKNDFDVIVADSGSVALDIVKENLFDIIVVDQRMPIMTGVQFLEKLNPETIDSIRILLTGYSDMQAIIDAINQGRIYYYCTKPWKRDELKMIFLKSIEYLELHRRNKILVADLSKTVKELDTFLYRASHNLKTPITSQLGLLSLLKMEVGAMDNIIILKIEASIQSLQRTIRKMQALSDYGYNFLKDQYEINLNELMNAVVEESKEAIASKKVEVIVTASQPHEFLSYRSSLQILFESILENAVRYSTPNQIPKISIDATVKDNNELEVTISDNGVGISPEILPHVFDPFYRGSLESDGSGLGLFVSRKICDMLNGTINIKSELGNGTKVTVTIPGISS